MELSKVKIEIFLGALFKSDACVKREIIFYIDSAVGGGDLAHFHKYTVAKRNFMTLMITSWMNILHYVEKGNFSTKFKENDV